MILSKYIYPSYFLPPQGLQVSNMNDYVSTFIRSGDTHRRHFKGANNFNVYSHESCFKRAFKQVEREQFAPKGIRNLRLGLTMMDDDEYGAALVKELLELTQELMAARRERESVQELLQGIQEDRFSLQLQVDQRSCHNQSLIEQELLKQQIYAKKREMVRLLKELAAAKR